MKARMTKFAIKEEVFKALQEIAPEAELEELTPNENFKEVPDIGAAGFLKLLVRLRQDLKVEIPESDYERVTTLSELVRYLSDRLR